MKGLRSPQREQHYQQMNERGTLCCARGAAFENKGDKQRGFSLAFIFLSAIVTELLHELILVRLNSK